jgi:hypothetical protein
MRLILRHRPSLHVWNVSDYLKQTHANILKQDTNKYITLQKIFRKIYLRHLRDHERLKNHQKNLDNFVLLSPAPARAITDYFHRKSKDFSEDFLRVTFQSVARAYQISKADHSGSLDTLGYKLFLSSEFCNLSEELKFALRNNKLSFETVASVLDSLARLEYVDHEVVNLLLLYVRLPPRRPAANSRAATPTPLSPTGPATASSRSRSRATTTRRKRTTSQPSEAAKRSPPPSASSATSTASGQRPSKSHSPSPAATSRNSTPWWKKSPTQTATSDAW